MALNTLYCMKNKFVMTKKKHVMELAYVLM
jgi:hypothetical protein